MAPHLQDQVQSRSLEQSTAFWQHHADQVYWHKKPSRILEQSTKKLPSGVEHPHWTWFQDGEISTCYNCVDRHVEAGLGSNIAIAWDSPVTKSKRKISYNELLADVSTFAAVLRGEGVKKGDVVIVYSTSVCGANELMAHVCQCP